MLVPAGIFDVVPRRGLVALKTLVDARVRLAGDACGNHLEMHHVVAGRGLMTLGAVHRIGGRMSELGNGPTVGGMTLRTALAEQFEMTVVVGMTRGTIETRLRDGDSAMRRGPMFGLHENLLSRGFILAVGGVAL